MSCHIRCDPPHFQNSCSMPFFGLTFLVYRVQFVNRPQMNGKKSLKIHPKAKLQNFHLTRSPTYSSKKCTCPPLFNLVLCTLLRDLSMSCWSDLIGSTCPLVFLCAKFCYTISSVYSGAGVQTQWGRYRLFVWMLPRSLQQIYVPLFIPFSFKDKMRRISFPNSLHALLPNFSWSWWVMRMGHWIVSSILHSWMVRCDFRQTIAVRAVVSISSLAVSNWNGKEWL